MLAIRGFATMASKTKAPAGRCFQLFDCPIGDFSKFKWPLWVRACQRYENPEGVYNLIVETTKMVTIANPDWCPFMSEKCVISAAMRTSLMDEYSPDTIFGYPSRAGENSSLIAQKAKRVIEDRASEEDSNQKAAKKRRLLSLIHGLVDAKDKHKFKLDAMLDDPNVLRDWSIVRDGADLLAKSKEQELNREWVDCQTLRYWQAQLLVDLACFAGNDRLIHWVVDAEGNQGKSWLAKYLYRKNPMETVWLQNGSTKDLMKAVIAKASTLKLVMLDLSRTNYDRVNWDVIERVKNGMLMSCKYEVECCMIDSPLLVVFANYPPDYERLSKDRWRTLHIEADKLIFKPECGKQEPLPSVKAEDVDFKFSSLPVKDYKVALMGVTQLTAGACKHGKKLFCAICYDK